MITTAHAMMPPPSNVMASSSPKRLPTIMTQSTELNTTTTATTAIPTTSPTTPTRENNNNNNNNSNNARKTALAFGDVVAKPSEIRARIKAEQERKDRIRRREEEAQLRMQKIKAEIASIQQREAEAAKQQQQQQQQQQQDATTNSNDPTAPSPTTTTTPTATSTTTTGKNGNVDTTLTEHRQSLELELSDLEQIEELKQLAQEEEEEEETEPDLIIQQVGKRVVSQMNASFARLSLTSTTELASSMTTEGGVEYEMKMKDPATEGTHPPPPPPSIAGSPTRNPHRGELQPTRSGKFRRVPSRRGLLQRTPSNNLVPEMRRRANKQDLMFDEDDIITRPQADFPSIIHHSHSPVTSRGGDSETIHPSPKQQQQQQQQHRISNDKVVASVSADSTNCGTVDDHDSTHSHSAPKNLPFSESKRDSSSVQNYPPPKQQRDEQCQEQQQDRRQQQQEDQQTTEPKRNEQPNADSAVTKSPSARKSVLILQQKQEEEKKERSETYQRLEEAKVFFQKGHDYCWKFQDSASALGEYRQALFIRESLLGKYHEDTGRTYYWIGRSLVKLKEYDEALVAFSRALRIFERVLMKNHKYNKWATIAIDAVFKDMPDLENYKEAAADYQATVKASIQQERAGDNFRKKGQLSEAVAEYRNAIENLEEYHPDAADLYCKIAIILRGQGEFDRAMEEYKNASEIYELSLGAEHPETVKTLNQVMQKKKLNQVSMSLMEKLDLKR